MRQVAGIEATESAASAASAGTLPLSVCAMTRGDSVLLRGVLELLRPLASEIVVAVDDRYDAETSTWAAVADEVALVPFREPGDAVIPWLHAQCRSTWILNIDDDEVPSESLLESLPKLIAADVTHWWLPRRWLYGDIETFLDEPPWVPDYQLRLYRNDPSTLRFSDEFHRPVVAAGPAGFASAPLWHLDCILNSLEQRRAKAIRYERQRRGMRVAGVAHNSGFYLPELRARTQTARLPDADVALVARLLATEPSRSTRRVRVKRATRDEIDSLWPGEPFDPAIWNGSVTKLDRLDRLPAGAAHTVTVAVDNLSNLTWGGGRDAAPPIHIGTRWVSDGRTDIEEGVHTPLPSDVEPGATLLVPVHVRAPGRPGRYQLCIGLVHEHVRWFGSALEWPIEVAKANRVAVIGQGENLELLLDRLQLEPDIEPVIMEPDARQSAERFGHRRCPGLGSYLLDGIDGRIGPTQASLLFTRTARLMRRARRLKAGKTSARLPRGAEECLEVLSTCDRLVVANVDWSVDAPPTRHFWRLAATVCAARTLGIRTEAEPAAIEASDAIDRLLAQVIRRA